MKKKQKSVKLTLMVRERNARNAKHIARKRNTSVSALFDMFLDSLQAAEYQGRVHPAVMELSGVIKGKVDENEIGRPHR